MTKRIASLTSTLLLALGIVAFAGSALAGNGNGNGNGQDAAAPTAPASSDPASQGSPGNSANAPGQVKKDQSTATAKGGGSADQNADASVSGVKPTSATAKGNKPTSCTTGGGTGSSATCTSSGSGAATAQTAAKADASKGYGNGTTAAQIANGRGAPAGTTLHGPGNSQPHKVAICPKKNNKSGGVDVHAVKSYSTAQCAAAGGPAPNAPTTQTKPTNPTGPVVSVTAPAPGPTASVGVSAGLGVRGAPQGGLPQGGAPQGGAAQGGVLGVSEAQSAGGVLGAIEAVGEGALPFTGFPLWAVMLVALALITFGLALRRHARATV
jgi:hypothetical protein